MCAKNVGSVRKKFTKGPRRLSKAHCWEGMRANWIFTLVQTWNPNPYVCVGSALNVFLRQLLQAFFKFILSAKSLYQTFAFVFEVSNYWTLQR